ncbi:acyl carrier protein [bacterium]|nr:acyl carrier protein [bacterium]
MSDERTAILVEYVRSQLLVDPDRPLDADTPLISEGLVDSMGLVMLAAFVEERFGARIEDADFRAGSLESIRDVVELIRARS